MNNIVATLIRVGGFAAAFTAFMVIAALVAGGQPGSLVVQGVAMLFAALGATVLLMRFDGRRPLVELGLERAAALSDTGGGFLLGIIIVVPVLVLAIVAGGLRYGQDDGTVVQYLSTGAWTVLVILGAAAAEEFMFRGYPLRVLAERWGTVVALVLTTAAFSVVHGSNPHVGPLALANIALAGLLLGMILLVTGSLWWAIGLHAGWNFATSFVADLPVSGLVLVDAPLIEMTAAGNVLLTGGEFGLEGGLAATAGLLLAVGYLAHRWRASCGSNASQ